MLLTFKIWVMQAENFIQFQVFMPYAKFCPFGWKNREKRLHQITKKKKKKKNLTQNIDCNSR